MHKYRTIPQVRHTFGGRSQRTSIPLTLGAETGEGITAIARLMLLFLVLGGLSVRLSLAQEGEAQPPLVEPAKSGTSETVTEEDQVDLTFAAESQGIFVGINNFRDPKFTRVLFAVDDAIDLAYLFAIELRLIDPGKVTLCLVGEPQKRDSTERLQKLIDAKALVKKTASLTGIYEQLDKQSEEAGRNGLLIVFFSTHGFSMKGTGDFLVVNNTLSQHMEHTSIPQTEVIDTISRSKTLRKILLIDACREQLYAYDESRGPEEYGTGTRPEPSPAFSKALAEATGLVTLNAAPIGGYAYGDPKKKNGVFTTALLDGLHGKAKPDERGFITVQTLTKYVNDKVLDWLDENHHPHSSNRGIGAFDPFNEGLARMPLAVVNPSVDSVYTARRDKALKNLASNINSPISGKMYDDIHDILFANLSLPDVNRLQPRRLELIGELELYDGKPRAQRVLFDYFEPRRKYLLSLIGKKPWFHFFHPRAIGTVGLRIGGIFPQEKNIGRIFSKGSDARILSGTAPSVEVTFKPITLNKLIRTLAKNSDSQLSLFFSWPKFLSPATSDTSESGRNGVLTALFLESEWSLPKRVYILGGVGSWFIKFNYAGLTESLDVNPILKLGIGSKIGTFKSGRLSIEGDYLGLKGPTFFVNSFLIKLGYTLF